MLQEHLITKRIIKQNKPPNRTLQYNVNVNINKCLLCYFTATNNYVWTWSYKNCFLIKRNLLRK